MGLVWWPSSRDFSLISVAGFLRSFGTGLLGVILGIYLSRRGYAPIWIGVVIALGLAGSSLATTAVGIGADRFGRRRFLIILGVLTGLGALGLASSPSPALLLVAAFIGMLNATGTDRSAAYALEQAVIPALVPDSKRTWSLAVYNVLIDGGGSLGALSAGLPLILQHRLGMLLLDAYRFIFLGFAGISIATAAIYWFMSPGIEVAGPQGGIGTQRIGPENKQIIVKLTALFSLDAFGGGFLTDALVSYWFFRRFGIAEHDMGIVFFVVHLLNALSHLVAAWLARRVGLLNTMIFTHLPSSLFLMAVPFAPSFKWAVTLFFCREALVEMDVPTRQSYVAAVVRPTERTLVSSFTNLARNVFWAIGSVAAGLSMQLFAFSAPLLIGGGAKVLYDILLFRSFRLLKPPEEIHSETRGGTKVAPG
jgi:MFS family permease